MIERVVLAVALLTTAAVAPSRFAPLVDQSYRYTTTETRTDGDVRYRFTVERRVVFHREAAGWTATVTIVGHHADAPPAMAQLFEAGQSALATHPVRYHLDQAGTVLAIDDEAGIWAALDKGVAHTGALPAPDAARRRAMLSSTMEALIAGDDALRVPGPPRAVRIAARPVAGTATNLAGTEQVSRTATGDLFLLTRAAGDPTPSTHIVLTVSRRIDPRTGLVTEQDRITDATRDGAVSRIETYTQLGLVS